MIDKDLQRNGSGYYDPTAYEAMKGYKRMDNKTGEIWTMALNVSGAERQFLILADHGSFCTGLVLNDVERDEHDVRVASKNMMYTHSGMISYAFSDRFIDYVKTVPEIDMDRILRSVADSLGISDKHSSMKEMFAEKANIGTVPDSEEITRLKAQLETYKQLYTDLLDSVIIRK